MRRQFRRLAGIATLNTRRAGFLALGLLMLLLGIVGAFLPLMPTTIFLIAAAWCFGRSSPRFEAWLLDHPRFGPPLHDWREQGAIPRKAKVTAWIGMALGYGLFWLGKPDALVAAAATAFVAAGAAYVATRPDPKPKPDVAAGPGDE
ncbi:YbaN family protein [Mesorhizobium sp. CC13]|uniref:YbaN family protein n=1 Tax=Mesorhizobium sp. CC13 TaxID=3029194 RepID=UPI003267B8E0